jgi:hypothetical protein
MQFSYIVYLAIIFFALVCGLFRYGRMQPASRILIILLGYTLISEYLADFLAKKFHNNMPVYHVYAPVQFFTISLYFNDSIEEFKRKNIGWYIGITGVIVSLLNSLFLQPFNTFNSYFLLFSGFVIISMSLFAFYKILENDDVGVLNNPHFWFNFILLFFWSTTYIFWSLFKILGERFPQIMSTYVNIILFSVSALTYLGFGLVFLFYPKKKAT